MIIKFNKIITCFVFLLLCLLISFGEHRIFAIDNFSESFSNLDNWEVVSNGYDGSWYISENNLFGVVGKQGNSFVLLKNVDFGTNFELSYDAKNNIGIDQELVFNSNRDNSSFYVINTRFYQPGWSQDNANEVLIWKCYSFTSNVCTKVAGNSDLGFTLNKDVFYNFKLAVNLKEVSFYIDDINVLNYTLENNYSGGIGFWNWGGDYNNGVSNVYKNFYINYHLTPTPTIAPTNTPTPTIIPTNTPTPTPVEKKKKIFILPGLGASWNSEAIVYNQTVENSDWKMTPFVNNYDGLIEMLKNNDLKENEDFFVWNYDWKKPVLEIENKFNSFVESKNLTDNDDVYFVGHSLGGLVARLWLQSNPNKFNIKEVITLGSPHLGSVDSYSVWNGGEVLKIDGISSVAFQVLLGLQNKGFVITDVNKIRSFAPILKDLLPTFDYVSKSGKTLPWASLETKNNYLDDKNQNISQITSRLSMSVGTGVSTPSVLKLGSRSVFDKTLGLWPDGELLGFFVSDGDGTVLKNSARLNQNSFNQFNSDHGEIVNKSIEMIADKIGLANKTISFNYEDNFSNSLVVFVGSPATSILKCGNDIFEENNGFIVAKNKNYNECDLTLLPTNNGLVHLVIGNTKNNQWQYFEKEVRFGINEKIEVGFGDGRITDDKKNVDFLKRQIRLDLEKLGLLKGIKSFDKGELTKVALIIFEYRSKNSERIISQRILDNLFYLTAIIGPNKNKDNYKTLFGYVDLIENTVNFKSKRKSISKNSVLSLQQLKNLEFLIKDMIADKTYPSKSMIMVLSGGYGVEALR